VLKETNIAVLNIEIRFNCLACWVLS